MTEEASGSNYKRENYTRETVLGAIVLITIAGVISSRSIPNLPSDIYANLGADMKTMMDNAGALTPKEQKTYDDIITRYNAYLDSPSDKKLQAFRSSLDEISDPDQVNTRGIEVINALVIAALQYGLDGKSAKGMTLLQEISSAYPDQVNQDSPFIEEYIRVHALSESADKIDKAPIKSTLGKWTPSSPEEMKPFTSWKAQTEAAKDKKKQAAASVA